MKKELKALAAELEVPKQLKEELKQLTERTQDLKSVAKLEDVQTDVDKQLIELKDPKELRKLIEVRMGIDLLIREAVAKKDTADLKSRAKELQDKVAEITAQSGGSTELKQTADLLDAELKKLQNSKRTPQYPAALEQIADSLNAAANGILDPRSSHKERDEIWKTIGSLSLLVKASLDPHTSHEDRDRIWKTLGPTTILLKIFLDPHTSHEDRDTTGKTIGSLTLLIKIFLDPQTSREDRDLVGKVVEPLNSASTRILSPGTPQEDRERFWKVVEPLNAAIAALQDPNKSKKEREEARKTVQRLTKELKDHQEPTGTACLFNAPKGAALRLENGSTVAYAGHVGWGFQIPGADQWIYGSTDGPGNSWEKTGSMDDMLKEFKTKNSGSYAGYRCEKVEHPHVAQAYNAAYTSTTDKSFSVEENNDCLSRSVGILNSYGAALSSPIKYTAPNYYFGVALNQKGWPAAKKL